MKSRGKRARATSASGVQQAGNAPVHHLGPTLLGPAWHPAAGRQRRVGSSQQRGRRKRTRERKEERRRWERDAGSARDRMWAAVYQLEDDTPRCCTLTKPVCVRGLLGLVALSCAKENIDLIIFPSCRSLYPLPQFVSSFLRLLIYFNFHYTSA